MTITERIAWTVRVTAVAAGCLWLCSCTHYLLYHEDERDAAFQKMADEQALEHPSPSPCHHCTMGQ